MADRFTVRINNDCVAPTIADDRPMASIQSKSLSLVLGDKLFDRLAHFGRPAPASFALHDHLLLVMGIEIFKGGYVVGNNSGKPSPDSWEIGMARRLNC